MSDHQRARIRNALLDLVAEHGYPAVTVRQLASLAGVSTRSFYQHYSDKEGCLLCINRRIARRALGLIESSSSSSATREEKLRRAIFALLNEWSSDPRAPSTLLVEAYDAGPAAQKQACQAKKLIEAAMAGIFADAKDETRAPDWLAEGMAAAVIAIVRSRILTGRGSRLSEEGDRLAWWARSCHGAPATKFGKIRLASQQTLSSKPTRGGRAMPLDGELALLLSAATRLAETEKQSSITAQRIFRAAGV
ncbi:MAG: TetR/AcrR family transcriptional regulator, partial [Thermoleophilia bacterium]